MASIYLNNSDQFNNVGAGNYGNEGQRMSELVPRIKHYIEQGRGDIQVYTSDSKSMYDSVTEANNLGVDRFLSPHTNAGGGKGTEIYHYPGSLEGYNFCEKIYNKVAPLTVSGDEE